MEIRDKVLKKLEEARQAKDIAASLEAKIIVSFPNSLISLLRGSEDMLREAFIVRRWRLRWKEQREESVNAAGIIALMWGKMRTILLCVRGAGR